MSPVQAGAGVLLEMLKQMWHRVQQIQNVRTKQNIGISETVLEMIRIYELKNTLDVLTNEFDASTVHNTLRILNLAERGQSPSPELARVYANACLTVGAIPWPSQARRYGDLARQTAAGLNNLTALAWVLIVVSAYRVGIGQWTRAKEDLEQGTEIFERLGDRRNWVLSLTALCFLAGFQGEFARWQEMASALYQVARTNEHGVYQAWGLGGQAMAFMRLGQMEQAAKVMNLALPLYASLPFAGLSEIFAQGTNAVLCLRQEQLDRARQAADITSRLLSKTSIPYFTLLESYAAVADVYLMLWEKEILQASNTTQTRAHSEMRPLTRQACKALHRFVRTYPIGRPHAWLCQGLHDWLNGKPTKAHRAWRRSIAHAEQLAMPYEEGLAHYELGRHVTGDERQIHLTRAIEIFERLETRYDLQQARAAKEAS